MAREVSDAAVRAATGKGWDEWFAILDATNATRLPHKEVALLLQRQHGLGGWWSQMVTVAYERARGLRAVHEKPGGFEIGKSKTVKAPVTDLYRAWNDGRVRRRWLPGERLTVRKATPRKSMRITWSDGRTQLSVNFYSKGRGKSQVTVQHGKLPDAAAAKRMKAYWGERLQKLQTVLEG